MHNIENIRVVSLYAHIYIWIQFPALVSVRGALCLCRAHPCTEDRGKHSLIKYRENMRSKYNALARMYFRCNLQFYVSYVGQIPRIAFIYLVNTLMFLAMLEKSIGYWCGVRLILLVVCGADQTGKEKQRHQDNEYT